MERAQPRLVKKVAYTLIPVADVERARRFYEQTLGLSRGAYHGVWTEYDLPEGGCVLLGPAKDLEPSARAGARVVLEVEDLDASVQWLEAGGVPTRGGIVETPVCRMAVIHDSEGNALVLHHSRVRGRRGATSGDARGRRPSPGR